MKHTGWVTCGKMRSTSDCAPQPDFTPAQRPLSRSRRREGKRSLRHCGKTDAKEGGGRGEGGGGREEGGGRKTTHHPDSVGGGYTHQALQHVLYTL